MKASRLSSHVQVSLLLICVVVLLIVVSLVTVNHHCDLMCGTIYAVMEADATADHEATISAVKEAHTQWEQSCKWLELFVPRQSIAEVNTAMAKLLPLAEAENDELAAECAALKAALLWMREQY